MNLVFTYPEYVLKRQGLSIFGKYRLYNPQDQPLLYIEEKGTWIPPTKTIRAYSDEKKTQEVLRIKTADHEDISDFYEVFDSASNQKIGSFGGDGDFFKDVWEIFDAENQPLGKMFEKSAGRSILRELSENLLPQQLNLAVGETLVGTLRQKTTLVGYHLVIDFNMDTHSQLDRRLGIAAAILVALHQGNEV